MAKQNNRVILPFAIPAKDRIKIFTKDMEMAAIYYLAERDRKKGEGRVRKKPEEKTVFIAETCYPIWLVPWKGRTLLFDGLEFTNQSMYNDIIPDTKAFETDIIASSKSRESYIASISQNISYFKSFSGKEEITIEGLITDPDFVQDLTNYIVEGKDYETIKTSKAFLSPMLDENEVATSIDKLSTIRDTIEQEIKNLGKSMRLLSKISRDKAKTLQSELRKSRKIFDQKISNIKPKLMLKIKKIQEKRDEDIIRISKKHTLKLRSLHKNRINAERTIKRLEAEMERIEAGIKVCRDRKDEPNEFQLSKKLDVIKKKIPILNKEIKEIDRKLENVEDEKKIEISQTRIKPDDQIEEVMKTLHNLEAAKEAKTRLDEQELVSLKEMTSTIIKDIDTMIKEKENALNELSHIGSQEIRKKQTISYLPVYFICYETEEGKRYVIYPPANVGSMGIKAKLKGAFGSGKMKCLLQCRSQTIATLLDRLVDLTQENPVFEKAITEAGTKASILNSPQLAAIRRGIIELKNEGWISENEVQIRNE
ncbi:hypothetical protein KJN74_05955 [Candidatus Bathyarchaeota archaeon]|nr:hypothetical protein [Candidatus Bathyarchaeota archaeon]